MRPEDAAVEFWLGPLRPEAMPMVAARLLADGHDSPAVREAAGPPPPLPLLTGARMRAMEQALIAERSGCMQPARRGARICRHPMSTLRSIRTFRQSDTPSAAVLTVSGQHGSGPPKPHGYTGGVLATAISDLPTIGRGTVGCDYNAGLSSLRTVRVEGAFRSLPHSRAM